MVYEMIDFEDSEIISALSLDSWDVQGLLQDTELIEMRSCLVSSTADSVCSMAG